MEDSLPDKLTSSENPEMLVEPDWLLELWEDEWQGHVLQALGDLPSHPLDDEEWPIKAKIGAYHPTGKWHIVQVEDFPDFVHHDKAIVRETESKHIVWHPLSTKRMAWIRGGTEMVLLRDFEREDYHWPPKYWPPNHQVGEYLYRYSWPAQQLISSCRVTSAYPGFQLIYPSPRGDLVAIQWWHQGEEGFEFVRLDDAAGDSQIMEPLFPRDALIPRDFHEHVKSGVPADEHQTVEDAAFSPSGRYMVFGQISSSIDREKNIMGSIIILDWDNFTLRKHYIKAAVPYSYKDDESRTYVDESHTYTNGIERLAFLSDFLLEVTLAQSGPQMVDVTATES